jgi:hypothetical protein
LIALLEGDYFMMDSIPGTPIDASLGAVDRALDAVDGLQTERRNPGVMRAMFGVPETAPAVTTAVDKARETLKQSRPSLRPNKPSI